MAAALAAPLCVLWACSGGDDGRPTAADGGAPEASLADQAVDQQAVVPDAGPTCRAPTGVPARALVVQAAPKGSELAVVDLTSGAVSGRLAFAGGYGLTSSIGPDPYLLDETSDTVTKLDAQEPWKSVASWDVRGDDAVDGGMNASANPVTVVPVSCNKAYVLRYNRNKLAVIDPSQPGGTPTAYIDLSPFKAAGDPDEIEMTSAVYVPSKRLVYVLLGNADFTKFLTLNGSTTLGCSDLAPSIIAIDPDTDSVVNLGGTAPGGGISLGGYNPVVGAPLVYDAAGDRLIVLEGGCNLDAGDGGAGAVSRRRVEALDLHAGSASTLLSLDDQDFPSALAVASNDAAALGFYGQGFHWDPTQTTLGASIQGGVDLVATDGRGAFLGTHQVAGADGGAGPLQVLAVPVADVATTVVASDPFTKAGGYVSSVEAWPHP